MTQRRVLTSVAELRSLRAAPSTRIADKEIDHIDAICSRFIASSPFCMLATRSETGCDVSPRGDTAGFVHVQDPKTLAIGDKPGNNRLDSFANIICNRDVALLFMIPGHGDCLRVMGQGEVVMDPDLAATLPGRRPVDLILLVHVHTAFLHCSRSIVRSGLWRPPDWPDRSGVPGLAEAMVAHGNLADAPEDIAEIFAKNDAWVLGEE